MIEIDLGTQSVIRTLVLDNGLASPQDVKLSPDGRTLYTADQLNRGLWEIDPVTFRVIGFLKTSAGGTRALPEPQHSGHVRLQPRGGIDLGCELPDPEGYPRLAATAARQP
jgi:hypothetical protein